MNGDQNKPQPHNSEREQRAIVSLQKTEMFSGPVPHPEIIEKYEKIYPGAAKIIFEEWDRQVKHRQHIEKSVIRTDSIKSILGVVLGFVVVIAALGGGVYTALKGLPLFGSGLSLAGLAMLATAFITSRKRREK